MTASEVEPLTMSGSLSVPPKRKESSSPGVLKRKYLRKVSLPFLPQLAINGKCVNDPPTVKSPSAFEQELADQENQSPNDPEFVRRASQRWRRKTGAVNHEPLQLLSQCRGRDLLPAAHYTKFQWPTSPSQQPAFQRRVSPQPVHYMESPFMAPPAVPLGSPPFQRSSRQYSSMLGRTTQLEEPPFQRSTRRYSSMMTTNNCRRKNSSLDPSSATSSGQKPDHNLKKTSPFWSFRKRNSTTDKSNSSKAKPKDAKRPTRLSFDDSVADDIRRAAQREHLQVATPGWATPTVPIRRLSIRIRQSLRTPKLSRSSRITPSVTSSTSYQSDLTTSSSYCNTSSSTSLPKSPSLSSSGSESHLSFQDIFVSEPKIAEKFAIMFPTEPRPEWHRHLRHVLHKAGQKIFKKPEPHDTNIPENLRYQLKHIYVY